MASRHQRISRAAELAVERARYEADRAERAFCAVEPENRLVARSLEARWEARLAALAEAEQALEAARDSLPPLPSRAELEKLAADLPGLWHAPATSTRDRKRLLRTLIADVTLLPEPDQGKVRIGIRWHTGATDELTRRPGPVHRGTARRSPSPAVEMVRQLGPVTPATELAGRLNAAGLTTGHGRPFDVKAVQWIRHAYHIPAPAPYAAGEISAAEAARQLGCSTSVIYHWIHTGQLTARRGQSSRLCIPWNDQVSARCQELVTQSARLGRTACPRTLPAPPSPAADGEVSVTEAAYQLGCSIHVIYYWIDTGKLAARRSQGGRLCIPWNDQVQAECRAWIELSGHLNPAARKTKPRRRHLAARDVRARWHNHNFSAASWPAPMATKPNPAQTRLQEEQYEITVPTVADRVVQAALKLVLEPIFEADFQPCSYGFRPGRRAHDAISEIQLFATQGYTWALEADIRACFDEIGHVPLMDRLRARIKDKRVLALVKAFLKAGVMTADGDREESYTGTPAGSL